MSRVGIPAIKALCDGGERRRGGGRSQVYADVSIHEPDASGNATVPGGLVWPRVGARAHPGPEYCALSAAIAAQPFERQSLLWTWGCVQPEGTRKRRYDLLAARRG